MLTDWYSTASPHLVKSLIFLKVSVRLTSLALKENLYCKATLLWTFHIFIIPLQSQIGEKAPVKGIYYSRFFLTVNIVIL